MLGSENIVKLYNRVLDNDMLQYNIPEAAVKTGIKSMTEVYKPKEKKNADRAVVADFNDAAHRCAYLHKYASLHTAMVRDLMFSAIRQNYNFFRNLLFSESPFNICSLGGGPGSDVVGVLASLVETFMYQHDFDFNISIVDYMAEWAHTFSSIMMELGSGIYGPFGPNAGQSLQWRYLGANLLKALNPEVEREISSASLVTMIKFVSAASCKDTEFMVKNIFSAMKPGGLLFFVDNDGGGFREIIAKYAEKFKFMNVFGPLKHENYSNPIVKTKRFGATSCSKTTVSVTMLQKPHENVNLYVNLSPGSDYSRMVNWNCNSNWATGVTNTPLLSTPLTPYIYKDTASTPLYNRPAALTPLHNQPRSYLLTPPRNQQYDSVLYSGNRRRPIFSPDTPRLARSRIQSKNGCLPFRHWRHHLSTKLQSFKSRIQNKYEKKNKKNKEKNPKDSK